MEVPRGLRLAYICHLRCHTIQRLERSWSTSVKNSDMKDLQKDLMKDLEAQITTLRLVGHQQGSGFTLVPLRRSTRIDGQNRLNSSCQLPSTLFGSKMMWGPVTCSAKAEPGVCCKCSSQGTTLSSDKLRCSTCTQPPFHAVIP